MALAMDGGQDRRPTKEPGQQYCRASERCKRMRTRSGASESSLAGSMTTSRHVVLINPTITSRRSARFPLAVLNLSASLDGKYESSIIDGNIDRDFVATTL